MKTYPKIAALVAVGILAGCAHSGTLPSPAGNPVGRLSAVTTGNFTEYSLPAGVKPQDLTRGPYDTVYFAPTSGFEPPKLYQMLDATGAIHVLNVPAPYTNVFTPGSIVSFNRSVTFVVTSGGGCATCGPLQFYLANVTPELHYSFTRILSVFDLMTNLALGPDDRVWFGFCNDACEQGSGGDVAPTGTHLDTFVPLSVTPGPGGNIYVTANSEFTFPESFHARLYVVSTSGAILHRFPLPDGSDPSGITTGPDHNLWITESGLNKIARVTPTGAVTQYPLPTPSAGPFYITAGYDSALFFTEGRAGKIGRITTSGSVTEYTIPTPNSGPAGITPCSQAHCGSHGGVWFTEQAANKIGKFNAPI